MNHINTGRFILSILSLVILLSACNSNSGKTTTVLFNILHARDKTVYLETVALSGEGRKIIDSAEINSGNAVISFTIREPEERVFLIRVRDADLKISFVNDVPEIKIKASIIKPDDYIIEQSPANATISRFMQDQRRLIAAGEKITPVLKDMSEKEQTGNGYKLLNDSLNKIYEAFYNLHKIYADTTTSAGVFLHLYSKVEFGKDYKASKAFITRAAERFPGSSHISLLKEKVYKSVKVFEEEYNVGDVLPALQLPDTSGYNYTTALARGKYVFMDMWSTWCPPCLEYDAIKKKAKQLFPPGNFEIVSIGFDPEKEVWKQHIKQNHLNWVQLIDEKVWDGETMRLYKIDSIPFNFLLGPDGRVLRKAIPPDSVLTVLSGYMK